MRRLWWKLSLGLSLGLAGSGAWADELPWRGGGSPPPTGPKVVLEAPRVMLGAPLPAGGVQQVNRTEPTWVAPHGSHRVVRAQGNDIPNPLPKSNEIGTSALPVPRPLNPPQISEGSVGSPQPSTIVQQAPLLPPTGQTFIPHATQWQAAPLNSMPVGIQPQVIGQPAPIVSTGPIGTGPCAVAPHMDAPLITNGEVTDGFGMWPFEQGMAETFHPFLDSGRWFFGAEYLMWWTKGISYPALITTGSPLSPTGGNLGDPTTQVLMGGDDVLDTRRDGGRFRLGYWFDDCHNCGLEATYFFVGEARDRQEFASSPTGNPLIARPFLNLNTGLQDSELVAFPGQFAGTAVIETSSNFWGGDINLRKRIAGNCGFRCDGLAGFRFLSLSDTLVATEFIQGLPGGVVPGSSVIVADSFKTANEFYGGQFGFNSRWTTGRWSLDLMTKLGLGSTYSTVEINGGQRVLAGNPPLVPGTATGGLLALNSNVGRYSKETFAVVPEVGLNIGWQATEHIRLMAGYNFLYWSSVMRAADQVDTGLDVNRVPNLRLNAPPAPALYTARPAPLMRTTDYWAQGLTFGLHLTW